VVPGADGAWNVQRVQQGDHVGTERGRASTVAGCGQAGGSSASIDGGKRAVSAMG